MVKLSGALFFSEKFEPMVSAIKRAVKKRGDLSLALIAGGGSEARRYISVARELGADQATQDEIGIEVSRLNARVLATALKGIAYPKVATSLTEAAEAIEVIGSRIVTLGGLLPGQSTNAVGALVAEKLGAESFYNLTDVNGVYTKNPSIYKDAKKLNSVSAKDLSKILGKESMSAGGYDLMDMVALRILQRSKIRTKIMLCDPIVLERALDGRAKKLGTEVITDS